MDCTPLKRLRLKDAFCDQPKFQAVMCDHDYIVDLFEWTDRGTIFIFDDPLACHSVFVTDTNGLGTDKTFRIGNPCHKDLFLWHIDGVLYKGEAKCDCAFLTDDYLGFVEFKANASNSSEAAVTGNYDKARLQLLTTVRDVADRCRKVGVDMMKATVVEAYAVFNPTVPRHSAYQKKLAAQFLLETDGIPLYFGNSAQI